MNRTLQKANENLMPNYGSMGLVITSGKGVHVQTVNEQGKRRKCIDMLCGLGVNSLGHCHPAVVEAIHSQSAKLMHVSNLYATSPMAELAERLVKMVGGDAGVFFCNDGTGANEAAGKLARIWAHEKFGPQKNKIVALRNSFHGRTFLSITMTGQPKMQEKFAPGVPEVVFAELNNIKDLRRVIDHDVCAVIFEVIQAEGGIHRMDLEYYDEIYNLSVEYDFLRIVDEVQTGIGRTGYMLAHDYFREEPGYDPEIVTLAKALGGGLPIGAMIARGEIGKYLLTGSHAATFGGNPVACAAGLAVLDVIEREGLLDHVNSLSENIAAFADFMKKIYSNKVKEVRGSGFIWGIELNEGFSASTVVNQMYEKNVLIGTAGPQVVRIMPPLIVTENQLHIVLSKLAKVIESL